MIKILFEGEHIIIPEEQLPGYGGAEVLGPVDEEEVNDCPYKMVSPEHLASVHIQKAIEATLVLSGYNLTVGLLVDEAVAVGMDIADLAQLVLANRASERAFEVERRARKVTERKETPSK